MKQISHASTIHALSSKRGISLIAVLMFMLAATTASIIVFRQISQENFASGARLKASEAYQASESGLDAARAWIANRAHEAGYMITKYEQEQKQGQKTIDLTNRLGEVSDIRSQNYRVYLTGVDTKNSKIKKLKLMSVGEGRDGSKVIQTAILSVDGLYKVRVLGERQKKTIDFNQAFYGGVSGNTQAKWSSAIINGDLKTEGEGIRTTGTTIVTGSVSGNGFGSCGQNGDEITEAIQKGIDTNNVYIMGNLTSTRFYVCGSAYVGGVISGGLGNEMYVKGDLYAFGGMNGQVRTFQNTTVASLGLGTINGNFTSCRNVNFNTAVTPFVVKGHVLLEEEANCKKVRPPLPTNYAPPPNPRFSFMHANSVNITLGDNAGSKFWSWTDIEGNVPCGTYPIIGRGGFYFPSTEYPFVVYEFGGCNLFNNGFNGFSFANSLNFKPVPMKVISRAGKPAAAKDLQDLAGKIDTTKGMVPDPIVLPDDTKREWYKKAAQLLDSANNTDVNRGSRLPNACIYLLKTRGLPQSQNNYSRSIYDNNGKSNALLDECYQKLYEREYGNPNITPKFLYGGQDGSEPFLPVALILQNASGRDTVNGNFIWIFDLDLSQIATTAADSTDLERATKKAGTLKLPNTTASSNVLVYLPKGAAKLEFSGSGTRNFFIFSDGNIDEASGRTTINGSVFLSQKCEGGTKQCSIGNLPDTELIFNQELTNILAEAGIIGENPDIAEDNDLANQNQSEINEEDIYNIPVSSRLFVRLESKEISKEKEEPIKKIATSLDKKILVMPRLVRLTEDGLVGKDFKEYFTYMLLNEATAPTEKVMPACTALNGAGTLNISGNNEKGIYRCISGGDITDFFVNVSGVTGMPEVSITPEYASVDLINKEARQGISLHISESVIDDYKVRVNVDSKGIWDITVINNACTGDSNNGYICTIAKNQTSVHILDVYTDEAKIGSGEKTIQFTIYEYEGAYKIKRDGDNSKIELKVPTALIVRNEIAENGWKKCPPNLTPDRWITIEDCDEKERFLKWECEIGRTVRLNYDIKPDDGCESVNPSTSTTIDVSSNGYNFAQELKWKQYTITVEGGTLSFESTNSEVTSSNGNVSTFTAYHGVRYRVIFTGGQKQAQCDASLVCTPVPMYLSGSNVIGYIEPKGNGTIRLENIPNPVPQCSMTQSSVNQNASVALNNIVNVTVEGFGCDGDNLSINYQARRDGAINFEDIGNTHVFSLTGNYEIRASVMCTSGAGDVDCGTITVREPGACEYNPSWCGGITDFNNIAKNFINNIINQNSNMCLFIKGIEGHINVGGRLDVNGVAVDKAVHYNNDALNNRTKADGGYYIYIPANNYTEINKAIAGFPECNYASPSSSSAADVSSSSEESASIAKSNSGTIRCNISGSYNVGARVPAPSVGCASGSSGNADFTGGDISGISNVNSWNGGGSATFSSPGTKKVYLRSLVCGGSKQTPNVPIYCGSIIINANSGGT